MKQFSVFIALFLVSQFCFSNQILTMDVYEKTSDRVVIDQHKGYIINVKNIDFIESVNQRLSQAVQTELESTGFKLDSNTEPDMIISEYRKAFSAEPKRRARVCSRLFQSQTL